MTGDACPHPELWIMTVLMSSYRLRAKYWKMHESGKENWQRKYFCGVKCHLTLQVDAHRAWKAKLWQVSVTLHDSQILEVQGVPLVRRDVNEYAQTGVLLMITTWWHCQEDGWGWWWWQVDAGMDGELKKSSQFGFRDRHQLSFVIKCIIVRAGSGPQLRCSSLRLHGGLPWSIESFFFCSLCFVLDLLCFSFLFLFPSPSCPVLYLIL